MEKLFTMYALAVLASLDQPVDADALLRDLAKRYKVAHPNYSFKDSLNNFWIDSPEKATGRYDIEDAVVQRTYIPVAALRSFAKQAGVNLPRHGLTSRTARISQGAETVKCFVIENRVTP
jgi:hypothetical protein